VRETGTVVLIHGLFGLQGRIGLDYFGRVRHRLERQGLRLDEPLLPWGGGIGPRARVLARYLARLPGPLHLLAHSMGGIDARYWIAHHDDGHRCVSLTTLGTPHLGSAAADHCCRHYSPLRLLEAVRDLTRPRMQAFDERVPDRQDIAYRAIAAHRPIEELPWPLSHYGRIIEREEGANDGLVSVRSALRWGSTVVVPCDHFELIGIDLWLHPWRQRPHYAIDTVYDEIGVWIRGL